MTFCTNCGKKFNAGATKCDACGASVVVSPTPPESTRTSPSSDSDEIKTKISGKAPENDFSTRSGAVPQAIAPGAQVGRVLGGRYQLDLCIGSGGMGEIYRARRLHIGDTVAVKILRPDVVENEKSRQRFYREARAAAMLHHPNAVVIHDFGEDNDGTAYIVMELLEGRSLRQLLIDEGSISAWRAYGIIRQASAALDAGHRNGIVHRDIKPDNIILLDSHDGADHIKILDFGIAKLRDKALDTASLEQRLTNLGTIIGTPHYMSPEQCQGEEADPRSDIYSLGVVLYELLTGVAPFVAKTPTGIAIKHVTEQPKPLRDHNPNISHAVERVVLRALEKDPNNRPQTTLELAREFESAVKDEPDTARLYKTGEQTPIDKSSLDDSKGTEVLPSSSSAERPRPVEPPSKSYDTVITPPSGTDALTPTVTTERKADTSTFKPEGAAQTELLEGQKKTSALPDSEKARTGVIKETPADPLRTNPSPPPVDEKKKPKKEKAVKERIVAPALSTPASAAPSSKSRAPLLAGIGVLLLAVAGVGAWLISGNNAQTETTDAASTTAASPQNASTPASSPTSDFPTIAAPEGMTYVLGGVLRIGRDDGEENERPAHVATLKPFFMDVTEVTNEQYQKFIDAAGYPAPPSWSGNRFPENSDKLPVTDVTWEDANAYAKWAGKRLPTEDEWEFAARGLEGRNFPWGADPEPDVANVMSSEEDKRQLAPVGQFPNGASAFGILDLSGNVWEWTASDYREYPGGKPVATPAGFSNLKVIRGGSFETLLKQATATLRRGWPATRNDWPKTSKPDYTRTGFRCVQDAKSK